MKKLKSKLHISDITPSSRFLLLEELIGLSFFIILSPLSHFSQFLSNFFKYSFLNFLSSHLYNIFTINFPGNSPLLKFFSSAASNFSCLLTSAFILLSNSSTSSLAFSKSFFFSQLSCSTINLFHHTKYFITSLTFLLFNIFSISYSSNPSTFTGFTSSFFYSPTCFLYYTTQLMFTTRWIFIEVCSQIMTVLVEITSSIMYEMIYQSTNFLTSLSLNTKSFVLNITLSLTFYSSTSFLPLSACLFISSYAFVNTTPTSSCIFLIFSLNSIAFSIFPFLLKSTLILNFLP